jgi:hypothetical protein
VGGVDGCGSVSGDVLDYPDQFVGLVTVPAREADEFARARDNGAALRRAGDRDAAAAPKLEQALVAQRSQRAQDRVGVDADDGREVARWRQPLARPRFAFGDRAADLGRDLCVQVGRIMAVDLDAKHGASYTSFNHANSPPLTMTTAAPPRPQHQDELDALIEDELDALIEDELDALIEEARRRARRRRFLTALVVGLLAGAGLFAALGGGGGGPPARQAGSAAGGARQPGFHANGAARTPEQVARGYIEAIAAGNAGVACRLSTSSFQRVTASAGPPAHSCVESLEKYSKLIGQSGRARLRNTPLTTKRSADWAWARTGYGDQYTLHKVGSGWLISSASHLP